jgi:chromosome segregation ATPase
LSTIAERINAANRSVNEAGSKFISSILCTAFSARSFSSIFAVSSDQNVQNANNGFLQEKTRVEGEIEETDKNITSTQNNLNNLSNNIKNANNNLNNTNTQLRNVNRDIEQHKRDERNAKTNREKEAAQQNLRNAQRKLDELNAQKRSLDNNISDFSNQQRTANTALANLRNSKKTLENRLKQVNAIIKLF